MSAEDVSVGPDGQYFYEGKPLGVYMGFAANSAWEENMERTGELTFHRTEPSFEIVHASDMVEFSLEFLMSADEPIRPFWNSDGYLSFAINADNGVVHYRIRHFDPRAGTFVCDKTFEYYYPLDR